MRWFLLLLLFCAILIPLKGEARHSKTFTYTGQCYHQVEARPFPNEPQNWYYVECNKDNTDYGFNKYNCEVMLEGKWEEDPESCDTGHAVYIQPNPVSKPLGLPKDKNKEM